MEYLRFFQTMVALATSNLTIAKVGQQTHTSPQSFFWKQLNKIKAFPAHVTTKWIEMDILNQGDGKPSDSGANPPAYLVCVPSKPWQQLARGQTSQKIALSVVL